MLKVRVYVERISQVDQRALPVLVSVDRYLDGKSGPEVAEVATNTSTLAVEVEVASKATQTPP